MSPPPVIAFDLDGTLVDTAPDLLATLNIVLATEGLGPVKRAELTAYVGAGARAMIERAYAAVGKPLSPALHETLFRRFLVEYDAHLADSSRPFDGVPEMLDRFAAAGWHLAICTNKLEGLSKKLMGVLGLADRFAVIAGQDTFGVAKPHPRHLTETIRAAGGRPERAVMVGDSQADVAAALAAHVPVVAVSFGYSLVPAADLGATTVIDHFDELDAAVATIMRGLKQASAPLEHGPP